MKCSRTNQSHTTLTERTGTDDRTGDSGHFWRGNTVVCLVIDGQWPQKSTDSIVFPGEVFTGPGIEVHHVQ